MWNDSAWSADGVVQMLSKLAAYFPAPFTIITYTNYSMYEICDDCEGHWEISHQI